MICSEQYLDALLDRDAIALTGYDAEKLALLGFVPRTVGSTEEGTVTDLMLRCPCDQAHRWDFYVAVCDFSDGPYIMGFRDRVMGAPGYEYRHFADMATMSKYNASTEVYEWMIATLRAMIEADAVQIAEEGSA